MNKAALALTLILLSAMRPAWAFEWYEHRRMGTRAFLVARDYAGTPEVRKQFPDAKPALDAFVKNKQLPYGIIVQCVDYFLFPEKIVAQIAYQESSRALTKRLYEACSEEGVAFFQATHANHAHFQQDLFASLELWHKMAIAFGREGDYESALWVNAIADHYLHDAFAPGHVVTPRERMTDVPATAMHDKGNRDGALFAPRRQELLKPILEFLAKDERALEELSCPLDSKNRREHEPAKCFTTAEVAAAASALGAGASEPIVFRGDGHLWDRDPEQLKQRLWLLAVEVRSILDLFEKGEKPRAWDTDFSYDYIDARPTASFSFGEYKFDDQSMQAGNERMKAAARDPAYGSRASTSLYDLGDDFPAIGLSAQREHMSSGSRTGRGVYSAEVSLASGITRELGALGALNVTWLAGYSYYQEASVHGDGPTTRIAVAVPATEFSTGPYVRYLSYQSAGGVERKTSWGWRIDAGFSGFATLYLGLGSDYGATEQGELKRGLLWQGGIQIQGPISRVFPWLK